MSAHDAPRLLVELGAAILGLALLARVANRFGMSAIPLYLIAGLCFGTGGIAPLALSQRFIAIGAEIGVLLLLFMLGLEYGGDELRASLRTGLPSGLLDFALNFPPGLIAGLLLGWTALPAVLLGGVTYISSSGVVAKVLSDLRRMNNPETPTVMSILVIEDLIMAVYLPLVAVLLAGGGTMRVVVSVGVAVLVVVLVLFVALRFGRDLSRFAAHESDEIVLLTIFGTVLLVAGAAQRLQVSAGIGAFLVGIAASGPLAQQSHRLLGPLRDLFAATFFFFFGLEVDPSRLPGALPVAAALAAASASTKVLTGYIAARGLQTDTRARLRAGLALIPRGEFSVVIAGLGVAIQPALGSVSAAYVLLLALAGPLLARVVK